MLHEQPHGDDRHGNHEDGRGLFTSGRVTRYHRADIGLFNLLLRCFSAGPSTRHPLSRRLRFLPTTYATRRERSPLKIPRLASVVPRIFHLFRVEYSGFRDIQIQESFSLRTLIDRSVGNAESTAKSQNRARKIHHGHPPPSSLDRARFDVIGPRTDRNRGKRNRGDARTPGV